MYLMLKFFVWSAILISGVDLKKKKAVGKVLVQHELEPFRQINEYNMVSENRLHYPYLFKTWYTDEIALCKSALYGHMTGSPV